MTNPFDTIDARLSNIENLLLDLKHTSKDVGVTEANQLLTIKQAAELLDLTVPTIYGYVHRREIPFSKKSRRLYFSKKELTDWIHADRKKTISEIQSSAETLIKLRRK
jgi:excisionase family DNA binding protein